MIRELAEEDKKQMLVKREREVLRRRLEERDRYFLCYLGGGDFLVHVVGIDPAIDRIYLETRRKEDE